MSFIKLLNFCHIKKNMKSAISRKNLRLLKGLQNKLICLKNQKSTSIGQTYYNSSKCKRFLKISILLLLFLIYIFWTTNSTERDVKSIEVTAEINSVLGTRLTAVRLLPEQNTTRVQPELDCNEKLYAVILVKSIPQNVQRRQVIRETWINLIQSTTEKVKVFFFIGVPVGDNETIINLLNPEIENYNDIIIEDMEEHYYLQTLKYLRLMKWFETNNACMKAQYLIKTEDAYFLHVPNIVSYIKSVPHQWVNYIGGQLHLNDALDRNPLSKLFAPSDWWREKYYPPFVNHLVILSSEVVPLLLNSSVSVPLFHLEDIYVTGMIAFDSLSIVPKDIPNRIESSKLWWVRLKMAFSLYDLPKTNLAFKCDGNADFFMRELYNQAIS